LFSARGKALTESKAKVGINMPTSIKLKANDPENSSRTSDASDTMALNVNDVDSPKWDTTLLIGMAISPDVARIMTRIHLPSGRNACEREK
jgi:hypothetical protein